MTACTERAASRSSVRVNSVAEFGIGWLELAEIVRDTIQHRVEFFQVLALEAGERGRLVSLGDLVDFAEQRCGKSREMYAVGAVMARIVAPLEIPLFTQAIDQASGRHFPDFECFGEHPLGRAWIACNGCDHGPLGSSETFSL